MTDIQIFHTFLRKWGIKRVRKMEIDISSFEGVKYYDFRREIVGKGTKSVVNARFVPGGQQHYFNFEVKESSDV